MKRVSSRKKAREFSAALIGFLIFLPFSAVVIHLLSSADLAFEGFVNGVLDFISLEKIVTYAGQFIFGIPVAFYLYGLIYGDVKGRYTDRITASVVDGAAKTMRITPKITATVAVLSFCFVYFVFFAVRAAYFLSAFGGELPETFTYAEYARRGFFELCAVAGINLGVLVVSRLTVKRGADEGSETLKIETILISLFTVLLIATALSKMVMYIDAYGLTRLRVFTSWFMILLLLIFLTICIRQLKKFNMTRIVAAGFVVMFMLLSFCNVDGMITKYNIGRFEKGTLSSFDTDAAAALSDAAVPYIFDLYLRTDDPEMRERLAFSITNAGTSGASGFREFNFQRHRADAIRASLPE